MGFARIIQPLTWPFILIPNLPLDLINMTESPVPFLIGIHGNIDTYNKINHSNHITSNIVHIDSDLKHNKMTINVSLFQIIYF